MGSLFSLNEKLDVECTGLKRSFELQLTRISECGEILCLRMMIIRYG